MRACPILTRLFALMATGMLVACQGGREPAAVEVDPYSYFNQFPNLLPGAPDEADTQLYLIKGLSGLIEHGDELMVMVYGPESPKKAERDWNQSLGESSLARWLAMGRGDETVLGGRFLRVPDLDDKSGSRFYYFERDKMRSWQFRAICTGAWDDDPAFPPTCWLNYTFGSKTVEVDLHEPVFLRSPDTITAKVLAALAQEGVIDLGDRVN